MIGSCCGMLPPLHREYIVFENERYTYSQIRDHAFDAANTLWVEYGVRKGDRVAICMRNFPEFAVAFWACCLLGAVPTNINAWQTSEGLEHCLLSTAPKVLLIDAERAAILAPRFSSLRSKLAFTGIIVARSTSPVHNSWPDTVPWSTAFTGARKMDEYWKREEPCQPDDDGTIFFTSGTTALPRAVLSSQRAFISNTYTAMFTVSRSILRRGEELSSGPLPARSFMIMAPLFHTHGLNNMMVNTFRGNKIVLMHRWNVKEAIGVFVKEQITETSGVPAQLLDIIHSFPGKVVLESATTAGAPSSPGMLADLLKAFPGSQVLHAWGLTETTGMGTAVTGEDYYARPTSCGLPAPITEILIVDPETLKALPVGTVGEIWVRGSNIMRCYLGDAEATDKALTPDGWFRSGDLGCVDKEGYLYIKDRLKDMIIRGQFRSILTLFITVYSTVCVIYPHYVTGI